jgi:CBS domain-containing protein
MQIGEVMNKNFTKVALGTTMQEAAEILSHTWVSELMVVDEAGEFVGVLAEGDMIRSIMPRFEDMMLSSGSLYEAFGMMMDSGHEKAHHAVDEIVIKNPITVSSTSDVIKAAATMASEKIHRLPVVDDGKLVGTISRADICHAVLHSA